MTRFALIAALTASLCAAVLMPGKAGAVTLGVPVGLSRAAAAVELAEPAGCNGRGCFGSPYWDGWGPTPWRGYPGYFPPPGFYRPWGFGWHRRWH
jgi:hypothetical protein